MKRIKAIVLTLTLSMGLLSGCGKNYSSEASTVFVEEKGEIVVVQEEPKENPLKEIAKLQKKSVLSIVTWDKEISEKTINTWNFPSKNRNRKGNLKIEKK